MTEPLSRRLLLKGAGAALALPLLEAMLPRKATAQAMQPTRLMLLHWPQGCDFGSSDWTPGNEGVFYPPQTGASWPIKR